MEVIQKEYSFKTPFESGVKIKSMALAVSVNLYFSQFFLKSVLQWCWEFYLRFSNIKLTKRWNLSKNVTNKNMKVSEKRQKEERKDGKNKLQMFIPLLLYFSYEKKYKSSHMDQQKKAELEQ